MTLLSCLSCVTLSQSEFSWLIIVDNTNSVGALLLLNDSIYEKPNEMFVRLNTSVGFPANLFSQATCY